MFFFSLLANLSPSLYAHVTTYVMAGWKKYNDTYKSILYFLGFCFFLYFIYVLEMYHIAPVIILACLLDHQSDGSFRFCPQNKSRVTEMCNLNLNAYYLQHRQIIFMTENRLCKQIENQEKMENKRKYFCPIFCTRL